MTNKLLQDMFELPSGSLKTFSNDDILPSLPVPSLRQTLDRYVDSVRPFVTAEELVKTECFAREFENGIGQQLHAKLIQRAAKERNWVEKWWENLAYLSNRQPLIPHCSMMGVGLTEGLGLRNKLSQGNDIKNLSLYVHHLMKFWLLLRTERLKPTQGGDGTKFSMCQFRRLFNTVRVPGDPQDTLISYFKTESEGPCPSHLIVMCAGRLFRVEGLDQYGVAISPADWEVKLAAVQSACCHHQGPGVGILSCDERSAWAKNRNHLQSLSFENRDALQTIDTSVALLVLDEDQPTTETEIGFKSLAGDFTNRWADKSIGVFGFKNGTIGGLCDHTAFDGMISVTAMYYVYLAMEASLNEPKSQVADISMPAEIRFHIDSKLHEEIKLAKVNQEENKKLIVMEVEKFSGYGKQLIQAHRLHPDSYIQMALQLAYFRLHNKPAPTYETATTRSFHNGRTETVRSCTVESMTWVKAMLQTNTSMDVKRDLLRRAVKKHDELMKDGRNNAGCDRHLFGLQCIAAEEGIQLPELFTEPAYTKSGGGGNFVLSTSLVGYTPIGGGVAPMCIDGYGVFYNIEPKYLQFSTIVWRASGESSASKFSTSIARSLDDMMAVLGPASSRL